ncbi:TMEM2 [Branchiostoma lanceolatum]|uniref:hyaluronoglucosaminidase n=1 Tax=Branchiostoma lanceolatum TaxID=7740 RepID=A0A8K0A184_BRALA|nr:TMEM2 [Branchiostoma lanceolatum]
MTGQHLTIFLVLLPVAAPIRTAVHHHSHECPDVDPTLTPWSPGHDVTSQVVVGRGQSYLLQSSASFYSLEIKDGGKLVFADLGLSRDREIVLKSREIIVGRDGEFHIGSEACRYQGQATVSLYGRSDDQKNSKQFLVTPGATLEVHGKQKLAWTQLAQTVPAGGLPRGTYYYDSYNRWTRGINIRAIDETSGAVVDLADFDTFESEEESRRLAKFIDQIPSGRIVALAANDEASRKLGDSAKSKIKELGSVEVDSLGHRDPWAFVGVKGDPSSAVEQRIPYVDTNTTGKATVSSRFHSVFGFFEVAVTSEWVGGRARCTFSVNGSAGEYVINLKDDVTSWEPGDHIVLASTDYNMEQAEEFELVPCEECSDYQVKINGKAKYTHFGEVSDEVDMRGEVGLLTRNVKFQGEVEDSCYGDNFCQFFDYDTYGGHLKILRGFKNVHLSGIEFTRMGQQVVGSYPVHFHMAGDVDELGGYTRPTYVRQLSIHHCFSRCVTIHGTHGLLVQETVGYDTLGHCFFLEDGVEQRNVLDRNLGLVTRAGTLLPTDRDDNMCRSMRDGVYGDYEPLPYSDCQAVSTFWIAHPNNVLTNNAAAGSLHGGIWYIFHRKPTGLSDGSAPMYESERTPLGRFYNNRVHSNGLHGLMIDDGVKYSLPTASSPQEYLARSYGRYKPHRNADLRQPRVPAMIEGLISFKNWLEGAWVRGGDIWFDKCAFVDNGIGLTMASEGTFPNDEGSSQQVWNSIFIGESENVGSPDGARVWAMGGVKHTERSLPQFAAFPLRGLDVYDGPILAESCTFKKYAQAPQYDRWSSAIGFHRYNAWQNSPRNNVTKAKFEDVQGRVFVGQRGLPGFDTEDRDGDKTNIVHDWDGSITGYPDTYIVGQENYLARNPGCVEKPDWLAHVCSGKYAQLFILAQSPSTLVMSMVRDEYPGHPMTFTGPLEYDPNSHQQYQPVVMLEKSYTIHWDGRAPESLRIYPINFVSGDWLRLGICYPPGTMFRLMYQLERRFPYAITHEEEIYPVSTLHAVEYGDGHVFYFEESLGLLFLKIRSHYNREGHSYCSHMGCERVVISATMTSDAVSNCTASAYPKYSLTPTETIPMPTFQSTINNCSGCGAPGPIVSDYSLRFLEVTILSAGWAEMQSGHAPFIEINGDRYDRYYRGFMVITVDARSGDVTEQRTFDTYRHEQADLDMANFIRNDIPENSIVLVAVRDEASSKAKECLTALKEIGAQEPVKTDYRGNFAMVGYKGNVWPTWIHQVNLPSNQGPAHIHTKIPLMG